MKSESRQEGAVSIVMLCLMLVVLMFSLSAWQTIYTKQKSNAEYRQEMQLRLAAEGMIEQAAMKLEMHPGMAVDWSEEVRHKLDIGGCSYPENMEVQVTALPRGANLYLIGYARYRDKGAKWERHRMVKGVLKKEGDAYVWLGWAP